MKKTRVILSLILAFVMLFSFAACGGGNDTADDNKDQQQQVQVDQDTDDQSDEDEGIQTEQDKVEQDKNDQASGQQKPSADKEQNVQQDEPKAPTAADAKAYIGKSASSLISALGSPISSQYSPSCMGDGEDGELVYNGFTVYTYREAGNEKVVDVA